MITLEKQGEPCILCGGKADYTLDSLHCSNILFSYCEKCKTKSLSSVRDVIVSLKRELQPIFVKQFLRIYGIPSPKEMVTYLNQHIVGQDEAKKIISVAIYNHFKAFALDSFKTSACAQNNLLPDWVFDEDSETRMGNVLLIGPPGSGKTLILEKLAKHYNLPIVTIDANTFTKVGSKGKDASSIADLLVQKAQSIIGSCNITPITSIRDFAEMGIVYIDEVDKIVSQNGEYETNGVQASFLTLIEGAELPISSKAVRKPFQKGTVLLNTSHVLFIAGGAFTDLEKHIADKQESGIGFSAKVVSITKRKALAKKVIQHDDLISYGLLPEFVSRFQTIATLHELSHSQLKDILTKTKYSLQKEYEQLFIIDNCKITFTDGAIDEIVKQALLKKGGARSLRAVLEELLLDDMYTVPEDTVTEIHINELRVKQIFTPHKLYAVA